MELIPFSYCEKINRSLVDYLTSPKNDLIFPPVQRIKTLKRKTQNLRKNIFREGGGGNDFFKKIKTLCNEYIKFWLCAKRELVEQFFFI